MTGMVNPEFLVLII